MVDSRPPLTQIIAHRGASFYAPENTLASMRRAHAMGAQWVEFDVMLTADGEAIIFHDDTLGRTTNSKNLPVADTPFTKIRELDAGSWFGQSFRGEKIPTLVEVLQLLQAFGMHINVEIKPTPEKEVETAEKTLMLLREHWPMAQLPLVISTQSPACLEVVYHQAPEFYLSCVVHALEDNWQSWIRDYHCRAVSINYEILTEKLVQDLHQQLDAVLAYTVNDPTRAQELLSWGVDSLFTDKPDLLR